MRFSASLQGKSSHEALLNLHDAELSMLENIKRCVCARVKCDRDYAVALGTVVGQTQKVDRTFEMSGSLVAKGWQVIIDETEALSKLLRQNTDYLSTHTLDTINSLISEKRASRKLYLDERNRIDTELLMFQDVVLKTRVEYKKCLEACQNARTKFEENYLKGKGSRKMDDVKDKYVKSCRRLHQTHNDYTLLLCEASQYERDFRTFLLPDLLEFHQTVQEELTQQCKLVLMEYIQYTDTTKDKFHQIQMRMTDGIDKIIPNEEYKEFIHQNKSSAPLPIVFIFDHDLIEDYTGRLKANQLAVDDFTYDVLKERMFDLEDRLKDCQAALTEKQELAVHFSTEVESMKNVNSNSSINALPNLMLVKKRATDILRREINELRCAEEKLKKQYNLIASSLLLVGSDGLPPPGLELPNDLVNGNEHMDVLGTLSRLQSRHIVDVLRKPFVKRQVSNGILRLTHAPSDPLQSAPSSTLPAVVFCVQMDKWVISEMQLDVEHDCALPRDIQIMAIDDDEFVNMGGASTSQQDLSARSPLTDEQWFHGVLPREEVVRLLVDDGDFLVRETFRNDERQLVLSVCWQGHKHFIIQITVEGFYRFEGPSFPNIKELVMFQHKSGLPVTNKSGAVLKNAVLREIWELNNDDVELLTKIGRGNFGDVYRARLRSTGEEVAVKTCRITLPEEQKKKFLLEGRILKQYDHPNIVKFIGICVQKQPIMIVMELVPGGSLLNFLRVNGPNLVEEQKLAMCVNAAAGMEYLESHNCIHRDLAARNCLIGYENMVKISDFGMSREEEEYIVSDGMKQIPIKWTAPEALNFGKYTSLCDIWSFGVLMWEIYSCGNTPYSGLSNSKAREMIDGGYRLPPPDGTPDDVYQLMIRCWDYNPERRPHFGELHAALLSLPSTQPILVSTTCDSREVDL